MITVAAFGVIGYVMERNGYPVAAMVLGIVMGTMVEQNFVTSLIKSDGSILPFFERPVSAILAALTIAALLWPVLLLAVAAVAAAVARFGGTAGLNGSSHVRHAHPGSISSHCLASVAHERSDMRDDGPAYR